MRSTSGFALRKLSEIVSIGSTTTENEGLAFSRGFIEEEP